LRLRIGRYCPGKEDCPDLIDRVLNRYESYSYWASLWRRARPGASLITGGVPSETGGPGGSNRRKRQHKNGDRTARLVSSSRRVFRAERRQSSATTRGWRRGRRRLASARDNGREGQSPALASTGYCCVRGPIQSIQDESALPAKPAARSILLARDFAPDTTGTRLLMGGKMELSELGYPELASGVPTVRRFERTR